MSLHLPLLEKTTLRKISQGISPYLANLTFSPNSLPSPTSPPPPHLLHLTSSSTSPPPPPPLPPVPPPPHLPSSSTSLPPPLPLLLLCHTQCILGQHFEAEILTCNDSILSTRRILYSSPSIPLDISQPCQQLMVALMHKSPEERLGAGGAHEVKEHPWFKVRLRQSECGVH